ncbi:MAG: hypothetical protein AB1716_10965 [Planctomycetota bacterium]
MNTLWKLARGLAVLVVLPGCLPEKRVTWSPDGKRALVRGADGLYVADAAGKLSERLLEGVTDARWLPDAQRVVLARSEEVRTWEALAPVLKPERRRELERRAPQLRAEILAQEGGFENFEPAAFAGLSDGEREALLLLVRDRHAEGLADKVGEDWKSVAELTCSVRVLQLGRLDEQGKLTLAAELARDIDAFDRLCVAPDGGAVAFARPMPGADTDTQLYVIGSEGGPARLVAENTSAFPAWSADGRWLAFASTRTRGLDDKKPLRLGVIARRAVRGEDGRLLSEFADAEELAGIVFDESTRVHWLRDGRVLFASIELHLPATERDMPERGGLYTVDPQAPTTVTRLLPRQAEAELPDGMLLFEVSPDERHVAVPGSEGLAIVDLRTADVWPVVAGANTLRMLSEWRGPDQLCVAVQREGARRANVALLQLDCANREAKETVLSESWPETVVKDWLTEKPESQPAGQQRPG